ncbi:MAG: hypothetical protein HRT87_02945 [Legionellales bacterium]|nr:hypothetical protein [Legionellales bacterium]
MVSVSMLREKIIKPFIPLFLLIAFMVTEIGICGKNDFANYKNLTMFKKAVIKNIDDITVLGFALRLVCNSDGLGEHLEYLIELQNFDVFKNETSSYLNKKRTALHYAMIRKDFAKIEKLIQNNCDQYLKDLENKMPADYLKIHYELRNILDNVDNKEIINDDYEFLPSPSPEIFKLYEDDLTSLWKEVSPEIRIENFRKNPV